MAKKCKCGADIVKSPNRKRQWMCNKCLAAYQRQYRKTHPEYRERMADRQRKWRQSHKNKWRRILSKYQNGDRGKTAAEKARKRYLASYRGRLAYLRGQAAACARRKKEAFDIDTDWLIALLELQDFKCAISGIKMSSNNDLCGVSINKIDPSLGYSPTNVQLVCRWVNHAKGNASNNEILNILSEVKANGTKLNRSTT